jgi:hypothetical protein
MNDTNQIREIAASFIEGHHGDAAVQQGAELLRLASEIDSHRAQASKLAAEERKLTNDLKESEQTRKHGLLKEYIALLSPLFTTVVLAGTLVQQSYQFVQSEKTKQAQFVQAEKDKDAEARRQADAAEDLRWAEASKLLQQSEKLSPAAFILKTFIKSERYGGPASQAAMQELVKTNDTVVFEDLFNAIFDPVSWDNAPRVIDLNRTLFSDLSPLWGKSWNAKTQTNDYTKLTAAEQKKRQYLQDELIFVSAKLAPVFKGARPPGIKLDLRSLDFEGDFDGADFRGAEIGGSSMSGISIKGADFSEVTGYGATPFSATAWWRASKIDREMLEYLIQNYPYREQFTYTPASNRAEYEAGAKRLRQSLRK